MYVVISLWFKFVETDLPGDRFEITVLGCRSLVLDNILLITQRRLSIAKPSSSFNASTHICSHMPHPPL